MLTKEQEEWLATFADKQIAEEVEATARNTQIDLATKIEKERSTVLTDLKLQAQALINKGLADFETTVVPTIK